MLSQEERGGEGDVQAAQFRLADIRDARLVHDAEHHDDVAPLGLRDELGDDADVVQRALRVRHAHGAHHEVDLPCFAGMVVSYLFGSFGEMYDGRSS
jgi:hypothetical protein